MECWSAVQCTCTPQPLLPLLSCRGSSAHAGWSSERREAEAAQQRPRGGADRQTEGKRQTGTRARSTECRGGAPTLQLTGRPWRGDRHAGGLSRVTDCDFTPRSSRCSDSPVSCRPLSPPSSRSAADSPPPTSPATLLLRRSCCSEFLSQYSRTQQSSQSPPGKRAVAVPFIS